MEPIFRMMVCSDVHYNENRKTEPERFEKGLRLAYAYARAQAYPRLDALYVVGDFADSGTEAQMQAFKASLDRGVQPETLVRITLASHEYREGEEAALARFGRIFGQAPDTHEVIGGFHLIALTTEHGCRMFEGKQNWLREQLRAAAADDPKKPIFVFQHPHLTDTVYGSINWGEDDTIEILMDYPQVIDFSGHSHAPVNDPRSIHQKYFTSVGTGSFSYVELDEFDKMGGTVPADAKACAQFLIVEAFPDGSVWIGPYDVLSESFFNGGYRVEKPWEPESFVYTAARYKTAERPSFAPEAVLTVKTDGLQAELSFPQAFEPDLPDSYTVRVRAGAEGTVVRQLNISSSYYLKPMPASRAVCVTLPGPGAYTAEVFANSFWDTRSDMLTACFTVG